MGFKKDFIWGGATASYQVEGAAYEDGKGLNIWDIFCKDGGHIYENQTGDVACDQYHRYKEDVQIMKEMGMKAYRFSLSWARIMPEGTAICYLISLGSSIRPSFTGRLDEPKFSILVLRVCKSSGRAFLRQSKEFLHHQ